MVRDTVLNKWDSYHCVACSACPVFLHTAPFTLAKAARGYLLVLRCHLRLRTCVSDSPLLSARNKSHLGVCRAGAWVPRSDPVRESTPQRKGVSSQCTPPSSNIQKPHLVCSLWWKHRAFYLNLYSRVDHRDCVWNLALSPSGWDTCLTQRYHRAWPWLCDLGRVLAWAGPTTCPAWGPAGLSFHVSLAMLGPAGKTEVSYTQIQYPAWEKWWDSRIW